MLRNWPAGSSASFYGLKWDAEDVVFVWYPTSVTSSGADEVYTVPLRVPKDAPVGVYTVGIYRSDDPAALLHLWDYYLVCRFRSSLASIQRGQGIRLSGRAPTWRAVTVFKRCQPAGQPSNLAAKGWVKVGTYRATENGRFATGLLHPAQTTWYVARYSAWSWGVPAFTQVVKVTVR